MQTTTGSSELKNTILTVPSALSLTLSNLDLGGFPCKSCGLVFKIFSDLKIHEYLSRKPIKCPVCKESFATLLGMKKHYGKMHAKYRPSRCFLCKKRFRNKYAAKRHVQQVHEEVSRISCSKCGKVLYNKGVRVLGC